MTFNLAYKGLKPTFLISLLFTLFSPILLPSARLMFFAPFLIVTFYQRPLKICLLWALFLGLLIDLLSSYHRFGITAFNYVLCAFILYPQKRHFFADRLSTLPLMTFCFSTLSLFVHYLIQQAFEKPLPFSWHWMATDAIIMPLFDAANAFIFYIAPAVLIGGRPRRGKDYFLS